MRGISLFGAIKETLGMSLFRSGIIRTRIFHSLCFNVLDLLFNEATCIFEHNKLVNNGLVMDPPYILKNMAGPFSVKDFKYGELQHEIVSSPELTSSEEFCFAL